MQTYFVYGPIFYTSELALFRAERVTAEYASIVEAPKGTHELYRIGSLEGETITHDIELVIQGLKEGTLLEASSIRVEDCNRMGDPRVPAPC